MLISNCVLKYSCKPASMIKRRQTLRTNVMLKSIFLRRLRASSFLLIFLLISTCGFLPSLLLSKNIGTVRYEFQVDKTGSTLVSILYRSSLDQGSSWILVPKFSRWTNKTVSGEIREWSLRDPYKVAGFSNPFYEAFCFSFKSYSGEFEISIKYNHSLAAMIIEPKGIFFSPQIGFEKGNRVNIIVTLSKEFIINRNEAAAFGSFSTYRPSFIDQGRNMLFFNNIPETENLLRVEIGFKTKNQSAELVKLHSGIFTFETTARYVEYARQILNFYNQIYDDLVGLFNVTLENAQVRFFLPEFDLLLSIGGYVPFSSKRLGDIHINIVYTRAVKGHIEIIALHELVHHFLWKAGISPENLLWFHEGMAQYVSIEICNRMGYEGAALMKQQIEDGILEVRKKFNDDFSFLQEWSPRYSPEDIGSYYIAAYYIVSELAKQHGGLGYYRRFFKTLGDERVESNAELAYYLSIAAGESVAVILKGWGFKVPNLYLYSSLLDEVKMLIEKTSRIFEPYRSLAEILYRNAVFNANQENEDRMRLYLILAVLIAKLAPLLTLMTVSMIIYCMLLWLLKTQKILFNRL
mgnify:CR=1 FL=1